MVDFIQFGDPSRFAVAIRWTDDSEPRDRRPVSHGWSMGDIKLMVGEVVLTQSTYLHKTQGHVGWYLSPLIDWLATNWRELFYEEDFAWREHTGLPAAVACRKALREWISAEDVDGRAFYGAVREWYKRHSMRAASEGGLFPDVFIRRLVDDVEVSWNAASPIFAPDGFMFTSPPGHAIIGVEDVAAPIWDMLQWFARTPPKGLNSDDKGRWETIARKIDDLDKLSVDLLQAPYVPERIAALLAGRLGELPPFETRSVRSAKAPVVAEFSTAVVMFGGVSPNLSSDDVSNLLCIFVQAEGQESRRLCHLVETRGLSLLGVPHRDGLDFANDLLDDLDLPGEKDWIDVEEIADLLGIVVELKNFDSADIRGVAIAGTGFAPRIVVNTRSVYNVAPEGKRFTIAHELCHLLHDRSRGRRIAHVSGPWVAQGFERRANAFAAYLLMPRSLVVQHRLDLAIDEAETVRLLATRLRVSESALVEHLFNLRMIDESQREQFRPLFRPSTRPH